jgi:hypothetical protein
METPDILSISSEQTEAYIGLLRHVFTYIFIKLNIITLNDCLIASVLHVKIVFQYV